MSMKSLLAIASAQTDDADVMAAAAAIVGRLGGQVRVLPAFPDPAADLVALGQALGAALPEDGGERLRAGEAAAFARVREVAEIAARRHGLTVGDSDEDQVLVRPRTLAPWHALRLELPVTDLVLISARQAGDARSLSGMLGDALVGARAPILAVRGTQPVLDSVAAIAWDGSLEAGRAVRAALPLPREAVKVIVLQDPDGLDWVEREAGGAERLVANLTRHGVGEILVRTVIGVNEGQALFESAHDRGAHLLVAGAYRHARLQEAILGGATRFFLEAPSGPHLLLCH